MEDASLLAVEAAWQRGLLGPIKSYHVPTMATILADIQRGQSYHPQHSLQNLRL